VVLRAQTVALAVRSQERVLPEALVELAVRVADKATPALVALGLRAMLEMAAMAGVCQPLELMALVAAAVARGVLQITTLIHVAGSGAALVVGVWVFSAKGPTGLALGVILQSILVSPAAAAAAALTEIKCQTKMPVLEVYMAAAAVAVAATTTNVVVVLNMDKA
jgi:hypothetical protein